MKTNNENNFIETLMTRSMGGITVPSRDEFRPVFDRVTKHESSRYTRQGRVLSHFFPNGFMIGSLAGIAIMMIAIIPITYRNYQTLQQHYELMNQESNQEISLLIEEDSMRSETIDKTLDQLITLSTT